MVTREWVGMMASYNAGERTGDTDIWLVVAE
jgi:hypothetical protein